MCAFAVRRLRGSGKGKIALLDVLGVLDPDRLVAMYYALPEDRRSVVLDDPAWAYYVQRADEDIPDAERWLKGGDRVDARTPRTRVLRRGGGPR